MALANYSGEKSTTPAHHKMALIGDRIARCVIWSFGSLCLLILAGILGFIIVNGLVTVRPQIDETLPFSIKDIPLEGYPGCLHISVRKDVRADSLEYAQVRDILSGMTTFWGFITGQNRRITVAVYDDDDFLKIVSEYFLPDTAALATNVVRIKNAAELKTFSSRHKGLIFFAPNTLPGSQFDTIMRKMKSLGLREYMLAVNDRVSAIYGGQRLNSISWENGDLERLLSGEVHNWKDLGLAADLSVMLLVPPFGSRESSVFSTFTEYPIIGEQCISYEDYFDMLAIRPGAAGIVSQRYAVERKLTIMDIGHIDRKVNLRPSFLFEAPSRAGAVGGISVVILNTFAMILFVMLIATPVGVAGAMYLCEYAREGRFLRMLRIGIDTLAGIPSILFGLFGFVFFSTYLGLKTGLLSGTFTLTLMILPTIIRTSEEAIRSVPQDFRQGSYAIGATKHQTVWQVVLPAASPGILTGVILGIGRAVGETAALLFTMGSNLSLLKNFNSPMRVLSVHLYMLIRENVSIPNAFSTATVLLLMVLLVNLLTKKIIGRMWRTY